MLKCRLTKRVKTFMKSRKKLCAQERDVKSHLETTINEVKQEFRDFYFAKRKDLITRLGNAFESVVSNPQDVCEEIKNCLQEEIADKIISARDIERYCPDKWKKKTKPKNDKLSFSKPSEQKPQQQITATLEGKSVIIKEPSSNTEAFDDVNQLHEQSKQNGITIDKSASYKESSTIDDFPPSGTSYERTGRECSSCLELQDKVIQLSEALQRISIPTADQIPPSEFEFTIPKENYEMVKDAMDKSNNAIFVKCDERKRFVRAVPDVDNCQ
jgi:hypothetical protein